LLDLQVDIRKFTISVGKIYKIEIIQNDINTEKVDAMAYAQEYKLKYGA